MSELEDRQSDLLYIRRLTGNPEYAIEGVVRMRAALAEARLHIMDAPACERRMSAKQLARAMETALGLESPAEGGASK